MADAAKKGRMLGGGRGRKQVIMVTQTPGADADYLAVVGSEQRGLFVACAHVVLAQVDRPAAPDDDAAHREMIARVRAVLSTLTPREERVLRLRSAGYTLEEVGRDYELTRERIRQIEAKAMRKLRHPARARPLAEVLPDVW